MFAAVVPAALQHVDETLDVGVDVGVRMVDRMTHAGLGREVDNHLKLVVSKKGCHWRTFSKINLLESEPRMLTQNIQPRLLQRRVVVVVEIVQTDNIAAF